MARNRSTSIHTYTYKMTIYIYYITTHVSILTYIYIYQIYIYIYIYLHITPAWKILLQKFRHVYLRLQDLRAGAPPVFRNLRCTSCCKPRGVQPRALEHPGSARLALAVASFFSLLESRTESDPKLKDLHQFVHRLGRSC